MTDKESKKQLRRVKRRQNQEALLAEREQQKKEKRERKLHQKAMQAGRKTHGLGAGNGGITEYPNGTIEYRRMMEVLPTFTVNIREVTGFSVRKATKEDKKKFKNATNTQIFSVQGSGTVLGESPVSYGTAEKIEQWFRAHPDFGKDISTSSTGGVSQNASVADELTKLAGLLDSGVITQSEFDEQKKKLLSS